MVWLLPGIGLRPFCFWRLFSLGSSNDSWCSAVHCVVLPVEVDVHYSQKLFPYCSGLSCLWSVASVCCRGSEHACVPALFVCLCLTVFSLSFVNLLLACSSCLLPRLHVLNVFGSVHGSSVYVPACLCHFGSRAREHFPKTPPSQYLFWGMFAFTHKNWVHPFGVNFKCWLEVLINFELNQISSLI